MASIVLQDIEVRFPGQTQSLFKVAQWEVAVGERILIQGPSGRGKTSLLHLISGLYKPYRGHVFVDKVDIVQLSDAERALLRRQKLGIIFQKLNLIDHLTVGENIQVGVQDRHLAVSELVNYLDCVQLGKKKDQRVSQLSLGEQQRVAVARVLAAQPQVVLADEPTSSLDEENANFVMESLFHGLTKSTFIVVSHDERIKKFFKKIDSFDQMVSACQPSV